MKRGGFLGGFFLQKKRSFSLKVHLQMFYLFIYFQLQTIFKQHRLHGMRRVFGGFFLPKKTSFSIKIHLQMFYYYYFFQLQTIFKQHRLHAMRRFFCRVFLAKEKIFFSKSLKSIYRCFIVYFFNFRLYFRTSKRLSFNKKIS